MFFPVFLLSGVSKYIFTDLAYGVVFSIFASYIFSMTLVPLFCAKFIHPKAKEDAAIEHEENSEIAPMDTGKKKSKDFPKKNPSIFRRGLDRFNLAFAGMLERYERFAYWTLRTP